ncbi:MAG: hypothetical protein HY420_00940, partial [Candidatus Kerfeldbacteria bacterium]|nr:hypothetical protein [Candidatus Kerfeldbacteria bacterium]
LGIEPMMSAAAAKRIAWAGNFGLKDKFGDKAPKSFHEVMKAIAEIEGRAPKNGGKRKNKA